MFCKKYRQVIADKGSNAAEFEGAGIVVDDEAEKRQEDILSNGRSVDSRIPLHRTPDHAELTARKMLTDTNL
jgi:hypothetical protein